MARLPPVVRSPASGTTLTPDVNLNMHFKVTEPQPSSPLLGNDGFVGDAMCRTRNKRFGEWAGVSYDGRRGLETEAQVWDEILRKRGPRRQAHSVFLESYDFYSFDKILAKRAEAAAAYREGLVPPAQYGHGAVGLGESWNKANAGANKTRMQTWMKGRTADLFASKRKKEQDAQELKAPLKDRIAQRRTEKEQLMERRMVKRDKFEIAAAKAKKLELQEKEAHLTKVNESLAQTKANSQHARETLLSGLQTMRSTLQSEKDANKVHKGLMSRFNCSGTYDDTQEDRELRMADILESKERRQLQFARAKQEHEESNMANIQDIRRDRSKAKKRVLRHVEEEKKFVTEKRENLKKVRADMRDRRLTDAEKRDLKVIKAAEDRRKAKVEAIAHKRDFKAWWTDELRKDIDARKAASPTALNATAASGVSPAAGQGLGGSSPVTATA